MKKSFLKQIQAFDIFPKTFSEAKEQSSVGAAGMEAVFQRLLICLRSVSIVGGVVLFILVFSELIAYHSPHRYDAIFVSFLIFS
jgi:hypothetical protein